MKKRYFPQFWMTFICLIIGVSQVIAQNFSFDEIVEQKSLTSVRNSSSGELLYKYSNKQLFQYLEKESRKKKEGYLSLKFTIGSDAYNIKIKEYQSLSEGFKVMKLNEKGEKERINVNEILSFKGSVESSQNGVIYLSISKNNLYGQIEIDGKDKLLFKFIQNNSNDSDFFSLKHVGNDKNVTALCEKRIDINTIDLNQKEVYQSLIKSEKKKPNSDVCARIELAIACDSEFMKARGLVDGDVPQIMNTMLQSVNSAYNPTGINFVISEIIITQPGFDPAPLSCNSAACMIDPFLKWKNENFTSPHDLATLWTGIKAGGYAYGAVPTGAFVLCKQNSNANVMGGSAVQSSLEHDGYLWAHELGHNLGSNHTPGNNYVMNNTVWPSSNQFAQVSKDIFAETIMNSDCINEGECEEFIIGIPQPQFVSNYRKVEIGEEITFTNTTFSVPTPHVWHWIFEGADQLTSTKENPPTIKWLTAGLYTVSLYAKNTEGDLRNEKEEYIEVVPKGTAIPDFESNRNHISVNDGILFTDLTRSSDSILTYSWTFDGGIPSSYIGQTPPLIIYENGGQFSVSLEVSNSNGIEKNLKEEYVFVKLPQKTQVNFFISNHTTFLENDTVLFVDASRSESEINKWEWKFEGGIPSTYSGQFPPVIKYENEGEYNIELTVCNSSGCSIQKKEEYVIVKKVLNKVISDFEVVNNENGIVSFCQGQSASFKNLSTGDVFNWKWAFYGGFPSSYIGKTPPEITYPIPGEYNVKLTVNNLNSTDEKILNKVILVTAVEKANVDFKADKQLVFLGEDISFTNLSTIDCGEIISYSWFLPGATPSTTSSENPTVTYDVAPGTFPVRLTVRTLAGDVLLQRTAYVTVVEQCSKASFFLSQREIYVGEKIKFKNASIYSGSGTISYKWTFEGGIPATSTEKNPEIRYDQEGIYQAKLVLQNGSCIDSTITTNINVLPSDGVICPDANFGVYLDSDSSLEILNGECVNFINKTSFLGTGHYFNWEFTGAVIDSSTSLDPKGIRYNELGSYDVKLIYDYQNGVCKDSIIKQNFIVVKEFDDPIGYCRAVREGCVGESEYIKNVKIINLMDQSIPLDNASLCNNYTLYSNLDTKNYNSFQEYKIEVELGNLKNDVTPNVTAYLDLNGDKEFNSSDLERIALVVDHSSGKASRKILIPKTEKNYYSRLRVRVQRDKREPCGNSTSGEVEDYHLRILKSDVGVNENRFLDRLVKIYPNPSNGIFNVEISTNEVEEYTLQVVSLTGKLIKSMSFQKEFGVVTKEIDLNGISSGIYQLNLESSTKRITKKIVID